MSSAAVAVFTVEDGLAGGAMGIRTASPTVKGNAFFETL